MDNNNPAPTNTVPQYQPAGGLPNMQQPPQASVPQAPLASTNTPTAPFSEKKILMWFGIGFLVIAIIVGGAYFYLSRQQSTPTGTITQVSNPQPVVQPTPKPEDTVDALDRDLSALNLEDTSSNFTSVDEDLEQL